MKMYLLVLVAIASLLWACNKNPAPVTEKPTLSLVDSLLSKYTDFQLTADLSKLTAKERQMISILVEAAQIMDSLFWYEALGDKQAFLNTLKTEEMKRYATINYGPWDRLADNVSFVPGIGVKPAGANFYPTDMTKAEFEKTDLEHKNSLYTFIRRDSTGKLITVWYHEQFKDAVGKAAALLAQAATLAEDAGLKNYLELRAQALLTDNYQPSDLAWMDMKNNHIDVVIGPIETYEDQLFGYKAAHEAYVLIKDKDWSARLAKYASVLPDLQKDLPVPDAYKQEKPGADADLNAYDVIYYAGQANAGGKTIAINLPNDEEVQLKKGTRRLQLKNAMKAKFDKILAPIANILITPEQRSHINFDAFFANTMFHEVAHGLGIKNLIASKGKGTVREALKEHYSALEEGKADILGLYMIKQLHAKGEVQSDLKDYYTTFMAGILRSVRFGAADAHGKANMICFNFFKAHSAFERLEDGTYRVNYDKLETAMADLSKLILMLQGDGDYNAVGKLVAEQGVIGTQLKADLDRLSKANIPVDIVFEQGIKVLN